MAIGCRTGPHECINRSSRAISRLKSKPPTVLLVALERCHTGNSRDSATSARTLILKPAWCGHMVPHWRSGQALGSGPPIPSRLECSLGPAAPTPAWNLTPTLSFVSNACGTILPMGRMRADAACRVRYTMLPSDFWPNTLFDAREGTLRDVVRVPMQQVALTTSTATNGVMHYLELDVKNLAKWFGGQIGVSGPKHKRPS